MINKTLAEIKDISLNGSKYDINLGDSIIKAIFQKIYPVGSIYMSTINKNPSNYWGGVWEAWGSGRVPVGVNANDSNFNTVEKTGGSANAVVVSHNHTQNAHTHTQNSHNHTQVAHTHVQNSHNHTQNAHNHEPSEGSKHRFPVGGSDATRSRVQPWNSATGAGIFAFVGKGGATTADTSSLSWETSVSSTTATNKAATATNQNTTATNNAATATNQNTTATNIATGVSGTNQNLQPYITCYMWKRTS